MEFWQFEVQILRSMILALKLVSLRDFPAAYALSFAYSGCHNRTARYARFCFCFRLVTGIHRKRRLRRSLPRRLNRVRRVFDTQHIFSVFGFLASLLQLLLRDLAAFCLVRVHRPPQSQCFGFFKFICHHRKPCSFMLHRLTSNTEKVWPVELSYNN